jgi:hypothetical protein
MEQQLGIGAEFYKSSENTVHNLMDIHDKID